MTSTLIPPAPSRLVNLSDGQMKLIHEALKLVDPALIAHVESEDFIGTAEEELESLAMMFGDDYSDTNPTDILGFCV